MQMLLSNDQSSCDHKLTLSCSFISFYILATNVDLKVRFLSRAKLNELLITPVSTKPLCFLLTGANEKDNGKLVFDHTE